MDRILVIEDDKDIAELIRDYFEVSGYDVTIVSNGTDGISHGASSQFDVILLDIMLPGADGFEVCKQLRKRTNIPILFVSAKDTDIDIIRGLGLGADDYIKKPFVPSELVARTTANLKRYRSLLEQKTDDVTMSFDNFFIDFNAMRITKNGEEINLANKEYELFAYFAKNPNKVLSREKLFSRLWDADSYGDINTVTVHIKRLREKVEDDPYNPKLIETVWGAGYRFNITKQPPAR